MVDKNELVANIDDKNFKSRKKALFLQRFLAFLIDILFVSFLATLITAPFVDSKKISNLEKKSAEIIEKFQNKELDNTGYLQEYTDIYYRLARSSGLVSLTTIVINILYFVVYQIYTKGQTLGKKLLRIRIVPTEGELFMNQMLFRAFIANFILFDIVSFGIMLFSPRRIYLYMIILLEMIQWIVTFISVVMIMTRKDGCAIHDKLTHTVVLKES